MDRRVFIGSLAAGLLAAPLAAEAQKAGKVWRIGVLGFAPATADMTGPDPTNQYVKALLRGLRERGYVYGQHFVTEPRGAEGMPDRYPSLVADLIRLKVDVIVAVAASLDAVKQATSTIPIVFPGYGDPVRRGFAKSLARPGGNFTGLSFHGLELVVKRLELLKELIPTPAPVAVLWDRAGRSGRRPKPPPEREDGNSCRSRLEMSARSSRLSGQRLPPEPARCSRRQVQPSLHTRSES